MRTGRQMCKSRDREQKKRSARRDASPLGWKGEICFGSDRDIPWLLLIGVKLGPMLDGGFHPCVMSEATFRKLEPTWGTYFWSLQPVRATARLVLPTAKELGSKYAADHAKPGTGET